MRDVTAEIDAWRQHGEPIALATVVQTWGSSPRQAGAKMALTPAGRMAGSVSGGCVEGAVFEAGVQSLKSGRPELLHFGVADETAWEVGLACGGSIDVFVQPLDDGFYAAARAALEAEKPFAVVTVVAADTPDLLGRALLVDDSGPAWGQLGGGLDTDAIEAAQRALAEGRSQRVALAQGVDAFIEAVLPPPTLVVVGGVHITIALVRLAQALGYRTVVVDPRKAFGSQERFAHADRLIQAWPDEALRQVPLTRSTAIAMLTHDPKLDDPALKIALPSPAFYVGALGSRNTQAKRRQRLLAEGLTEAQLDRLHGPIGLDLNAGTPEEIALSIMAEIVATRNAGAA
jgi:xanthine dehydrogenase accessory factor